MTWIGPLADAITPVAAAGSDFVSYVISFGVLGIGAVLYQLGLIVPRPVLSAAERDGQQWRKAYEDERAAHQATRESLAVSNSRAEAAVEAARVTGKLLEIVQQRKDA